MLGAIHDTKIKLFLALFLKRKCLWYSYIYAYERCPKYIEQNKDIISDETMQLLIYNITLLYL